MYEQQFTSNPMFYRKNVACISQNSRKDRNYFVVWKNILNFAFGNNHIYLNTLTLLLLNLMKRTRTLSLIVFLLLCIPAFAQWTKPKAPASAPLATGTTLYLYNSGADGFLVGANEWGTRASFSSTAGHQVILEPSSNDASSYKITNAADNADTFLPLYIKAVDGIWVDESGDNTGDDLFTFISVGNDTYKIGLSALNAEFNPTEYPNTYLGVIPEMNDTRLYLTDPETYVDGELYNASGFHITWYFVTPANYLSYTAAMKQYLAAMDLGDMIATAEQTEGISADALSQAKTVFANTNATVDELTAATQALKEAIDQANFNAASVDKPFEMLSARGDVEQTFTNGETTGWTTTIAAQNKQASNGNAAVDYNVTGNHYENWSGNAFGTGRIYATLTNIPNGLYRLSALAFANVTGGTYLYAGNNKTLVESTKINIEQETSVLTIVTDNTLEFGLRVDEKGTNWVGIDNVNLYYLGESHKAYRYAGLATLEEAPDYETYITENEGLVFYQKSAYKAFLDAKYKLYTDATMKALYEIGYYGKMIAADITAFKAAVDTLQASLDAYAAYYQVIMDADDWLTTMSNDSEAANILGDYLMSEEEPAEGEFNGNGGSQYLLMEGLLDVAGIQAEQAYLAKLLNDAVASGMSDGDDCTELLKNPLFTEEGGWTSAVGPVWPIGSENFRVFQAQNMVCDVYQQLTGLQNGLYEMNLQAVFRPGDSYSEENAELAKAYAYINSYENRVTSADVNSADDASAAFAEGQYPLTVYGLVTDGTMRVGITNKVRSVEGCMLWAGGVKLTFRAKNAEVLNAVIAQTLPNAEALLGTTCGQAELDTLQATINEAQAPADAYNALVTLKAAMEDIAKGADIYEKLAVAIKSLDEAIKGSTTASAVTIANAQAVLTVAQEAYNGKAYDNNQAEQAVNDVNAAAVSVKMGGEIASEDNPVDYTSVIVNNNFDPAKGDKNSGKIEGWVTTAMNGYKEFTVSYNRAAFELNQKLSGLPKGKYKVTVHTYYRAGYYDEEEALMAKGEETHLTTLYAQTSEEKFTKPVMNLTEGASDVAVPDVKVYTLSNGKFAPDGTTPTAAYFKAGYYLNELEFTVPADGEVTIGLSKKDVIANDYEVVGEWHLWYMGDPEQTNEPSDVSTLIVNNNFDPAKGDKNSGKIEGWVTTAMNGYKEYTVSYNRAAFELNQTLSGLPEGTYKVTVHTYYRAGYYDEEEALMAKGEETHLTTLYAQTAAKKYSKPVMNLTEGASDVAVPDVKVYTLSNGKFAPDGTTPTAAYFKAGYYLNELPFYVGNDGTVTIGLSKKEVIANDYEVVGEWKLYYYGTGDKVAEIGGDTAIKTIECNPADNAVVIYSTSGARLATPQRGINIIHTAEGKTIKVLVK